MNFLIIAFEDKLGYAYHQLAKEHAKTILILLEKRKEKVTQNTKLTSH
jgi:hypothetical protein